MIKLGRHMISLNTTPLVVAELGINHEGSLDIAIQMVDAAYASGCECVKTQCHIIDEEMIPCDIRLGNSTESLWEIISRCSLDESEEKILKQYVETKGMLYLSTPFSYAAVDRLVRLGISAFKVGSGECNNYPLVKYIANIGKPVFLSTGMNDLHSISLSVDILRKAGVPFVLMHCTSIYPTPYNKVRLGALEDIAKAYPDELIGYSDHCVDNFACYAAATHGACIIEKHFMLEKSKNAPDAAVSIKPSQLKQLVQGVRAIHKMHGGHKVILQEEHETMDYAFACVVSTRNIYKGERLKKCNISVKRPGTGEIPAHSFSAILGRVAKVDIQQDSQIKWVQLTEPDFENCFIKAEATLSNT